MGTWKVLKKSESVSKTTTKSGLTLPALLFEASLSEPSLPEPDLVRWRPWPTGDPESLLAGLFDFLEAGLPEAAGEALPSLLPDRALPDFTDFGLTDRFDDGDLGVLDLDLWLPERTDFGLPEWADVGLPERADFELVDRADSALPDRDFGLDLTVFGLSDTARLFFCELSDPDGLGERLDRALPERSDGVLLRCEPAGLGLRDFWDGELEREDCDASDAAGLTERLDAEDAFECGDAGDAERDRTDAGEWDASRTAGEAERADTGEWDASRAVGEAERADAGDADRSDAGGLCTGDGDRTGATGESGSSPLAVLADSADGERFPRDFTGDETLDDALCSERAGDGELDLE